MAAPKGNQFAAKAKKFEGALRRALVRSDGGLNRIADKLIQSAEAGEQWAVQMVAERLDGKAKTVIAGDQESPIQLAVTAIERRIVDGPNAGD